MRVHLYYIFFLLFFSIYTNAQDEIITPNEIRLSEAADARISGMVYDSTGYLWIGAGDVLFWYDGQKLRTLDIKSGYMEHKITGLYLQSKETLWVTSRKGLIKVNLITRKVKTYTEGDNDTDLLNSLVSSALQDNKGRMWFGTFDGLSMYDPVNDNFKNYRFEHESKKRHTGWIISICETKEGLWLSNMSGDLILFTEEKGIINTWQINNNKRIRIIKILKKSENEIWIGTRGSGLLTFNTKTEVFDIPLNTEYLNNSRVYEIIDNQNGCLTLGTDYGLILYTLNEGCVNLYNNISSVTCLIDDDDGGYWFNSWQRGTLFHHRVEQDKVTIKEHSQGELFRFYPYNGRFVSRNNRNVSCLFDSDFNKIEEIGVFPMFKIDHYFRCWQLTEEGMEVTAREDPNKIIALIEMPDSIIKTVNGAMYLPFEFYKEHQQWLFARKHILIFDIEKDTFSYLTFKEIGLPDYLNYKIYGVCFYGDELWMFFKDEPVYVYNVISKKLSKRFEKYKSLMPATEKVIRDSQDRFWCIFNGGVMCLMPNEEKPLIFENTKDLPGIKGLPIVFERVPGEIWVSSYYGLGKFNADLNEYYSLQDMFSFYKYATFQQSTPTGDIVYHFRDKFFKFNPDSIIGKNNIADVQISDILINNKKVKIGKGEILEKAIMYTSKIKLPYNQSKLYFEISILNTKGAENSINYYMLDGLDNAWNNIGKRNNFSFNQINPGNYTLKLKTRNPSGQWSKEKTLDITITPLWYQTLWFKFLLTIPIILIFMLFYILRIRVLKKRQVLLENEVKLRTEEVVLQKEELKVQAENLQEANDLLKEKQEEITAQSQSLAESNSELKTLNATKDKFFSIIAHDLKNPFMGIMGLSETLEKDFVSMEDHTKQEFAGQIKKSSKAAFSLLENLLMWARSQTKSIKLKPTLFKPHSVVTETLDLLRVNAEKKNISFINEVSEDVEVFADSNMITTVIRNLVNNAIKFTPSGGKVIVSAKNEKDSVKISIMDTGVGIAPDKIDHLFRIDKNYSTPGTSGEGGTGLGLLICQEFVTANTGEIKVESELGKGTVITMTLPI